jgi:hypothetical protein
MDDTYSITPHILTHHDGGVLCLPTDESNEHKGIAVFTSRYVAEEMAPDGFYPVYCGPKELERLAETLHVWLVVLIGLGGDLEGSVLDLDAFVGALLDDMR